MSAWRQQTEEQKNLHLIHLQTIVTWLSWTAVTCSHILNRYAVLIVGVFILIRSQLLHLDRDWLIVFISVRYGSLITLWWALKYAGEADSSCRLLHSLLPPETIVTPGSGLIAMLSKLHVVFCISGKTILLLNSFLLRSISSIACQFFALDFDIETIGRFILNLTHYFTCEG